MNNDLISREAAVQLLRDKASGYTVSMFLTSGECHVARVVATECAVDIKDIPAVDVVPVVHGRWYKPIGMAMPPEHHGRHRCSVCDHMAFYERPGREGLSDYCPNCGAKMDGQIAPVRKCATCQNDGWDMPQCRECNERNGFEWYVAKKNGGAE